MIQSLNHATLGLLDQGRSSAIIDRAIEECVRDLEDRGADGRPRTITIKIELTQTGEDRYSAHVEAGTKRPAWRTADHAGAVRKDKGQKVFAFQEWDSDDVNQQRIEDIDHETGEIKSE